MELCEKPNLIMTVTVARNARRGSNKLTDIVLKYAMLKKVKYVSSKNRISR